MSKVSDKILKRVYLLFGVVALFSVLILIRVVNIQYINGAKWKEAVQSDRIYERVYKAARGSILSEEGDVLAESIPFYYLSVDPSLIDREDEAFQPAFDSLGTLLSESFGEGVFDADYFKDKFHVAFDSSRKYLRVLNRLVDYETYMDVCDWPLFRAPKYQGGLIGEKVENRRHYPYDSLARITLGLMDQNRDTVPLKGLEYAFDSYLKGQNGLYLVQRMPGNVEKPLEVQREDQDGADIVTTLSVELQDIVETELKKTVKYHKAKYGVVVLMEVETGEIKAMANYPEDVNRAVAYRHEPGSTFKLASAMALLEDRYVSPGDSIETGNGTYEFFDRTMRDHLAMGKISFYDAFIHSSNVAFSKLVNHYYGERLDQWFAHLEKFGITEVTMPRQHIVGERTPIINRPSDGRKWNGTTLPWMSIGYNTQLTPLQICAFYNAVANDGQYMEPMLVREVRQNAKVTKSFQPVVLREKVASQRTINIVKKFMEGVCEDGTAKNLSLEGCKLAGKTGTAQKYQDSIRSYSRVYQASFCGYFPADNPRYTCYVFVDEPNNGAYYGGNVAAPLFKEVARQVNASDLEMVPFFDPEAPEHQPFPVTRVVHQRNAGQVYRNLDIDQPREAEGTYVRVLERNGNVEFSPANLHPGEVPNVVGMTSRDAVALLEGLGLRARLVGHGKVARQSLRPGTSIAPQATIDLQLH